mgnify:FL=1
MEKEDVIKIRTAIKAGKNLPVRVFVDNAFTIIDESQTFQFTKWDDDNGILYSFRLIDPQSDKIPNNIEQAVSVYSTSYANIQAIETPVVPMKDMDSLFGTIEATGCKFSEDFKSLIKHAFTEVLHHDRYQLSSSDINSILGPNTVNDKDDYYYNKFTENFKETRRYADRNAAIDEANKKDGSSGD